MVIVVMGPAGAGKTTVGRALAGRLGWRFLDADDLHSAAAVNRIRRGEALTDRQRAPWLAAVAREIRASIDRRSPLVVACSALKKSYRDVLRSSSGSHDGMRFVYLNVSSSELRRRLESRGDHFAPPSLIASQLATLETPARTEGDVVNVDGEQNVDAIVEAIRHLTVRDTG